MATRAPDDASNPRVFIATMVDIEELIDNVLAGQHPRMTTRPSAWRSAARRLRRRPRASCTLYASCPPLDTEEEQRALCGRSIIAAHILDGATGWFMGKVQNFGVGPSWKQPDATHIVVYNTAQTKRKELDGRVACKLTADNHGRTAWWLLLDPVAS